MARASSGKKVLVYQDARLTKASFDREIQKPFEAAYAPTSSDALHDLAQLFNGEDGRALFLRLDGPAVYLIVATVLQFPPCSALAEIVFSFMVRLIKLCLAQHSLNYRIL